MKIIVAISLAVTSTLTFASDFISLFDIRGKATAYITPDLTIYLWSGKPVAALERNSNDDFNVYSFNGKHLGWFARGVLRDRMGHGVCIVRELSLQNEIEPIPPIAEISPIRSIGEIAPIAPIFSSTWSKIPCYSLLTNTSP